MEGYHILIVEDDKDIRDGIEIYLKNQGYIVSQAADGIEGLKAMEQEEIHLAIVDIMMPRMDGITMMMKMREKGYDFPVIMLSAKSEEVDKIMGLNMGADDYVAKPFGTMELISRVRAVLRRFQKTNRDKIYEIGELYVEPAKHIITVSGKEAALSYKEYILLLVLLEAEGDVVERERLLTSVWGEYYTESRTLDVHIRKLRVKLGEAGKMIQTVKGIGYKLGGVSNE